MTLHIFNPSHDLALAAGIANFTPPHAARELATGMAFLPALWAADESCVLVSDVSYAKRAFGRARMRLRQIGVNVSEHINFIEPDMLSSVDFNDIQPWGWNISLCRWLKRKGVDESLLPSAEYLSLTRALSHRAVAAALLSSLQGEGTVGESFRCRHVDEVMGVMEKYGRVVVKAPWSCSGRGLRFVKGTLDVQTEGWINNVLLRQRSVMVEPYYDKVRDFGMEFKTEARGTTRYVGLSFFSTANGAYEGNLLATEEEKRALLLSYIPSPLVERVRDAICRWGESTGYVGPFGVDMMIVGRGVDEGFLLHPCVEVNLRSTMGHVAIALSPREEGKSRVMTIDMSAGCRLRILKRPIQAPPVG